MFKKFLFWDAGAHRLDRDNIWKVVVQGLVVAVSALLLVIALSNYTQNINKKNIELGFDFLDDPSGYQIGQSLIRYDATDTYFRVYLVGLLNTLLASFLAIVGATILGVVVGISLLARNVLLRKVAEGYVELLRNLPPLLHVLFWYVVVILKVLPNYEDSINIFNLFFLNVRGLTGPLLHLNAWRGRVFTILCLAVVVALFMLRSYSKKNEAQGKKQRTWYWNVSLLFFIFIIYGILSPFSVEMPERGTFGFEGGFTFQPELFAIVVALISYTSTYIGTIVRSAILSIPKVQIESSHSLGLSYFQRLRFVIIPLALRSMIPPLTNQYLNIIKNSSLGVAIGYPEIVAVFAGTALNQSGRAIEIMSMVMITYLGMSLLLSWILNIYNNRVTSQ